MNASRAAEVRALEEDHMRDAEARRDALREELAEAEADVRTMRDLFETARAKLALEFCARDAEARGDHVGAQAARDLAAKQ